MTWNEGAKGCKHCGVVLLNSHSTNCFSSIGALIRVELGCVFTVDSECIWAVALFDILALCHSSLDLKLNHDYEVKVLTHCFNLAGFTSTTDVGIVAL